MVTVNKSLLQMVMKYLQNPQTDLMKLKQHYTLVFQCPHNIPEENTKGKYQGFNFMF